MGDSATSPISVKPGVQVQIGASNELWAAQERANPSQNYDVRKVNVIQTWGLLGQPNGPELAALDIGIAVIFPPVVLAVAPQNSAVEGDPANVGTAPAGQKIAMRRPRGGYVSANPPVIEDHPFNINYSDDQTTGTAFFSIVGWGGLTSPNYCGLGLNPYDPNPKLSFAVLPSVRQAHDLLGPLDHIGGDNAPNYFYWQGWFSSDDYQGIAPGDSGGPLFDPSNHSQIGVASSSSSYYNPCVTHQMWDRWADVTAPAARLAIDTFSRAAMGQDLSGNQTISTRKDRWLGETDYPIDDVGGCDLQNDPDCDGFYDAFFPTGNAGKGDTCPGKFNPLQIYAPDTDGDGFADNCDTCPLVKNPDQADFDGDGLGDACDPCPHTKVLALSSDSDGDGLDDRCDNCPTVPNPAPCDASCVAVGGAPRCITTSVDANFNVASSVCALQPDDADGDGLGDACDDCPATTNSIACTSTGQCFAQGFQGVPNACSVSAAAIKAGKTVGVCTGQIDSDQDGRGDACDNCRYVKNWSFPTIGGGAAPGAGPLKVDPATPQTSQIDSDNNGLGDACDNCRGPNWLAYAAANVKAPKTCFTNLDCPTTGTTLGSKNFCQRLLAAGQPIPKDGPHIYRSVCAGQPDADQDGTPDICDNCKNIVNPLNENCNEDTESAFLPFPYRGDACDPVPCVKPHVQGVSFSSSNTTHDVTILYTPNVLPSVKPLGAPEFNSPPVAVHTSIKMCPIFGMCAFGVASFADTAWIYSAQSADVPVDMAGTKTSAVSFSSAVDPTNSATTPGWDQAKAQNQFTTWHLDQDVLPSATYFSGTFWTNVDHVVLSSGADVVLGGKFDPATSLTYHQLANGYGATGIINIPKVPDQFKPPPCTPPKPTFPPSKAPECSVKGVTGDNGQWPAPGGCTGIFNCPSWADSGALLFSGAAGIFANAPGSEFENISSAVSPAAASALSTPGAIWLSPSEPPATRTSGGATIVGVSGVGTLVLAELGPDPFGNLDFVTDRVRPRTASLAANASAAADRYVFGAALSGTEQAVFISGGVDITGKLHEDLVVIPLGGGVPQTLQLHGPKPAMVMAMTYRAADRSLFVVDHGSSQDPHRYRLLRISVETGNVAVLGKWHISKNIDRFQLAVTEESSILLVGSSTKQEHFVGGILKFDGDNEDDGPSLVNVFSGAGDVFLPPIAAPSGFLLPVFTSPAGQHAVLVRRGAHKKKGSGGGEGGDTCDDVFP
jgi:hypothetical protein